ncbi:hypothetical protein JTM65_34900, partial [Pseudomonas aeruginosa]|nr:hypothetical protein [Pseudomonas aeruginosa]
LATPKDIVENPKHLKILEIESPQIPRSLDDVDLAVINGNYALEAGLVPAKDALGLESAEHNPYANILVTTPALANDPRIKALANELVASFTLGGGQFCTRPGLILALRGAGLERFKSAL